MAIRRVRRIAALPAITAVLTLAACTGSNAGGSSDTRFVSGNGTVITVPVDERTDAPGIAGRTLDGPDLDVADLRGDVVVLNVWASWCGPCRTEAPGLQRSADKLESEGVRFVGIATRDDDNSARTFLSAVDVTYPSLVDPDGRIQLALRDSIPPQAVPSTIVLDREGRVAAGIVGPVEEPKLTEVVRTIAREAVPSGAPSSAPAAADS